MQKTQLIYLIDENILFFSQLANPIPVNSEQFYIIRQ